jgi:PAS domain S-box-containing protein
LDHTGRWLEYFLNQKWVDYTGLTLEESYGHGWNTPFHPDDRQRAWDAWQNAVNNNATYSFECRLRRADGTYRWWLVRGVPLINESGAIEKWFGTCTDIHDLTWRKQVEIELKAAKAEAESASLAKSKFLAAASHDLRQPVQSLVFLLAVLKRNITTPLVAKAVAGMEDALAGLSNLLNAILDISRIDAGVVVPHMKNADVSEMVLRLGAEYANRCRHKNLKLRCHCKSDLHAITDSGQLERIIRNLI